MAELAGVLDPALFSARSSQRTRSTGAAPEKPLYRPFDTLSNELKILIFSHVQDPWAFSRTCRSFHALAEDDYPRARWFITRHGPAAALLYALRRPALVTPALFDHMMRSGAVLSRYLCQVFVKTYSGQPRRGTLHWDAAIPTSFFDLAFFSHLITLCQQTFGELYTPQSVLEGLGVLGQLATAQDTRLTDGELFTLAMAAVIHREQAPVNAGLAAEVEAELERLWNVIDNLFERYNFVPISAGDASWRPLLDQMVRRPKVARFAINNKFGYTARDCQTAMERLILSFKHARPAAAETIKTARELADVLIFHIKEETGFIITERQVETLFISGFLHRPVLYEALLLVNVEGLLPFSLEDIALSCLPALEIDAANASSLQFLWADFPTLPRRGAGEIIARAFASSVTSAAETRHMISLMPRVPTELLGGVGGHLVTRERSSLERLGTYNGPRLMKTLDEVADSFDQRSFRPTAEAIIMAICSSMTILPDRLLAYAAMRMPEDVMRIVEYSVALLIGYPHKGATLRYLLDAYEHTRELAAWIVSLYELDIDKLEAWHVNEDDRVVRVTQFCGIFALFWSDQRAMSYDTFIDTVDKRPKQLTTRQRVPKERIEELAMFRFCPGAEAHNLEAYAALLQFFAKRLQSAPISLKRLASGYTRPPDYANITGVADARYQNIDLPSTAATMLKTQPIDAPCLRILLQHLIFNHSTPEIMAYLHAGVPLPWEMFEIGARTRRWYSWSSATLESLEPPKPIAPIRMRSATAKMLNTTAAVATRQQPRRRTTLTSSNFSDLLNVSDTNLLAPRYGHLVPDYDAVPVQRVYFTSALVSRLTSAEKVALPVPFAPAETYEQIKLKIAELIQFRDAHRHLHDSPRLGPDGVQLLRDETSERILYYERVLRTAAQSRFRRRWITLVQDLHTAHSAVYRSLRSIATDLSIDSPRAELHRPRFLDELGNLLRSFKDREASLLKTALRTHEIPNHALVGPRGPYKKKPKTRFSFTREELESPESEPDCPGPCSPRHELPYSGDGSLAQPDEGNEAFPDCDRLDATSASSKVT
ncbi:uncharacterized protein L969DRAFT_103039 [Mixia osmundae IAM 14324]|uniref:F-box domain-containing protein n=1 Tax=Mixia osmundae (strain CBS 9802 / IAM 14324 / JCM 22182 / KY 12970) TaxID=764103 RepID=G7EA09_MIXOS|nr:uncharacterized protein L969DRAFT_103039 [Mixia osmundae IAM 14324]KEI40356.1 hypothetical protein L969DRAFT_103039 [Mixia osmundae IAM 14324]GAA99669.1 hypothetical protein E5Q_06372 [Mixia osmundae IAM 14324]